WRTTYGCSCLQGTQPRGARGSSSSRGRLRHHFQRETENVISRVITRPTLSRRGLRVLSSFVAAVLAPAGVTAQQAEAPAVAAGSGVVYRVPVTGVVEMGLAPFIERSLAEASAAGARAAILDIDTPGGRVDAAEQIADAI